MIPIPAWAGRFQTGDPDEVRSLFARYGTGRRVCIGRGALSLQWRLVSLGNATLAWQQNSLGQRVHASAGVRLLHLSLGRPVTYLLGRRVLESTPGRAVVIAPHTDYVVTYGPESHILAIQVDEAELCRSLGALGTGAAPAPKSACEVPLSRQSLAGLGHLVESLQCAGPPSPGARTDAIRRELTSWFAATLQPGLGRTRRAWAAESRLRGLEEWIDGHLAEALELDQLCRIAGLSARGLRSSFVKRRGMTPMQWVASRRIAAARMRLMAGAPDDSVTRIAVDHGLTHAGRFSVAYRRRYGEPPSVTLSRSRPA